MTLLKEFEMRVVPLLIAVIALGGCATSPPDIAERPIANGMQAVRSVVLCQTKVSALESQLGTPSRDGLLGKSRVITWIIEWDPLVKYLGVMADENGTVVDLYWDLPSEVQWAPLNRCK